jgi:hypothetical protein
VVRILVYAAIAVLSIELNKRLIAWILRER